MIGLYLRLAFLTVTLSPWALAQAVLSPHVPTQGSAAPEQTPPIHLRLDSSLVLVPTQVTRGDHPVLSLQSGDFQVFENSERQELRYFAEDDAPVSVGLLLDTSASMRGKERKAARAAETFFQTANPADEFFLITFDETARVETRFTTDQQLILRTITHSRPYGRTALFDAIQLGVELMKHAQHRRKALVILSDGADNRSRHTFAAIKNAVLESDVQLYALGIFANGPDGDSVQAEEAEGTETLAKLAEQTGGQFWEVDFAHLEEISSRVGRLLRNEYLLGYSPANVQRDGTYRKITVQIRDSLGPAHLQYRRGYFAPAR